MGLTTSHQDDGRADHQQTTDDVEDRSTDTTGAGEGGASIVDNNCCLSKIISCHIRTINCNLCIASLVVAIRNGLLNQSVSSICKTSKLRRNLSVCTSHILGSIINAVNPSHNIGLSIPLEILVGTILQNESSTRQRISRFTIDSLVNTDLSGPYFRLVFSMILLSLVAPLKTSRVVINIGNDCVCVECCSIIEGNYSIRGDGIQIVLIKCYG